MAGAARHAAAGNPQIPLPLSASSHPPSPS
jgi:hypothetical protein